MKINKTYKLYKFIKLKYKCFLYSYFIMWSYKSLRHSTFKENFNKIKLITKVLKINYKKNIASSI